ncbi:MAG: hypothetical protein JWM80_1225 [Cyanobacteria bacterium RYN_339]|nr:hypothetical protein [Cyanobacteria bacterium RYN_339]
MAMFPRLPLVLAAVLVAGCPSPQTVTPAVVPNTVAAVCTPGPSVAPSATASATPAPTEGFRDDFDGTVLDPTRWASFPQSGIIRFENGKLDLLNTNNQKNFPYVLAKQAVFPASGPFFLEVAYTVVTGGTNISFSLDYLPAETPGEKPITKPFMSTTWFYNNLQFNFDTENGAPTFQGTKGYLPALPHRLRIENDGSTTYRVIFEQTEVGTFQSKRRPTRFWIGSNPVADLKAGAVWPRIQVDYVAAGPLTAPDPANADGTATPSAAP